MREKGIFLVFALIGAGLILGATFMFSSSFSLKRNAIETTGKVVRIVSKTDSDGTIYYPEVSFKTKDNQDIVFSSNMGSSYIAYDEGDNVPVLYLPEKPYGAKIDSLGELYVGPIVISFLALIFGGIGFGALAHIIGKEKMHKRVIMMGHSLEAEVTEVEPNHSYKVNGRSPFMIFAQAENPGDGTIQIFKSENIWFNPKNHIKTGDKIKVYYDPAKPSDYLVDISFLPKLK